MKPLYYQILIGILILGTGAYLLNDCTGLKQAQKRFNEKEDSIQILKFEISGLKDQVQDRDERIVELKETDSIHAAAYQKEKEVLQGIIRKRRSRPPVQLDADQQDEYFINEFGNTLEDTAVVNMVIDSLEDRKQVNHIAKLQGIQINKLESTLEIKDMIIASQDSTINDQMIIIQKQDSVDTFRQGQIQILEKQNKKWKGIAGGSGLLTILAFVLLL
jgi:hypothetical protein